MKTTLKSLAVALLALVAVITLSTESYAQRQQQKQGNKKQMNIEERAEKQTDMIDERINLSDDQEDKVEAIILKYLKKQEKLREDKVEREEAMKMMKSMNDSKNAELELVLDKKQYKEYLKMVEEQRQKQMQNRKRR